MDPRSDADGPSRIHFPVRVTSPAAVSEVSSAEIVAKAIRVSGLLDL